MGFSNEDEEILNLGSNNAAKIKSNELNSILKSHFKTFIPSGFSHISFIKNCGILDQIQASLLYELSLRFEGIDITKITISPTTKLPKDIANYRLIQILLNQAKLSNGGFRAIVQDENETQKIIGFSYIFKATMPALIATVPIASKSLINPLQTKSTRIDFDKFKQGTLTHFPNSKITAKRTIKPAEILNYQFIAVASLVKKGSTLEGIVTEDGISISMPIRALESGNLGDIIKVENKENKIFKANIISAKKAIIQ